MGTVQGLRLRFQIHCLRFDVIHLDLLKNVEALDYVLAPENCGFGIVAGLDFP